MTTSTQTSPAGAPGANKASRYDDIRNGAPANGLVWGLENIDNEHPPTDECFYTRNGRQFLRSFSWENKMRRRKERLKTWYAAAYDGDIRHSVGEEGDEDVLTWQTPVGAVVQRYQQNHISEYPVKTMDDLDVWIYVQSHLRYVADVSWFARRDASKVTSISLPPSPVQQLLQHDMGVAQFYYFLADDPDRMMRLLDIMQERALERMGLGLSLFPCARSVYQGENTSSSMISPAYYRRLTLPHIKAYARLAHGRGKRLNVHMCGLLRDLLGCFVETEMDGIDSVTPPPVGNTPFRLVRETFKPDFFLHGRFNAQLWIGKDRAAIQSIVREMIAPELLSTPFVLAVTSDAMPDIPREDALALYDALQTMTW